MTTWTERWQVPIDHPSFAGHFPGHPILPGVVILAKAQSLANPRLDSFGVALVGVSNVKFLREVVPGTALRFEFSADETFERVAFAVRDNEQTVATGILKVKVKGRQ